MSSLFIFVLFVINVEAVEQSSRVSDTLLPPLNKVPKSVYLLKKARVDSDVGEPIVYSNEQQMRMLYHDIYYKKDRLPFEDLEKFK